MADKIKRTHNNAWLLDFGDAGRAAVGMLVLLELVEQPETFRLPYTPPYCNRVFFWKDHLLPVMDVAARLGEAALQDKLLAVIGYQSGEATRFGALLLASPPVAVTAANSAACPLPEAPSGWRQLSTSCFDFQGEAIPVLNLSRLFASP